MRKPRMINLWELERAQHEYTMGEVYVAPLGNDVTDVKTDFEAVVDVTEGETVGMFRGQEQYNLIPHDKVINAVKVALDLEPGELIEGNYWANNKKMYLYIYPPEWEADFEGSPEVGDTIRFGYRITNSMDGTLGLSGHLVALRLVCENGMMTEDFITGYKKKHSKGANFEDFVMEMEHLFNHEGDFTEVFNTLEEATKFQAETKVVLEPLHIPEALSERVIERLPEETTLWEIYDEMTRHITHGYRSNGDGEWLAEADYSEGTLERLHKQANKVILMAE